MELRVVTQRNRGVSEARNEGVRQSSGELLAFVDSDDIWMPEKIELQVKEIITCNASAVTCSYAIFRDSDIGLPGIRRCFDAVRKFAFVHFDQEVRSKVVEQSLANGVRNVEALEKDVRRAAGKFVSERTKRRPMIVPVVMET